MTRTRIGRLLGAVAVAAVLAVVGWRVLLARPSVPAEADGDAWLAGFADLLTSPRALGAQGPAALALFPGLGAWSSGPCVTAWSLRDASAPIVTYQSLDLGRLDGDACDQAQFGLLSTTLRTSDGVTPGALVERFTERFGPPEIHRDRALRGSITYLWLLAERIHVHLEEPVGPGRGDTFSVLFMRGYGGPTALATPAEAERWMDGIVALATGPDLPAANPQAAIRRVGVDMEPERLRDEAGCPAEYAARLDKLGPIDGRQELRFSRADGQPCEEARFEAFRTEIWQREPVTAEALVKRIKARLGEPTVSRTFDHDGVSYRWNTPYGTAIDLYEGVSGGMGHSLRLLVERP